MSWRAALGSIRHQGIAVTLSQRRWHKNPCNEDRLLDLEVDPGDTVIDGGGFRGDFASDLLNRFPAARIVSFEPDETMSAFMISRFSGDPRVVVCPSAVWSTTTSLSLDPQGIASRVSQDIGDSSVVVSAVDVLEVLEAYGPVRVMKLNVEGAEYAVLRRLCSVGRIGDIDQLLVQFHVTRGARCEYRALRRCLASTHLLVWRHPWAWEYWRRRPAEGART